ncbi:hypothetical protein Goklo_029259 [Gossypium klotzschianum]|uniref:Uncharacterized protein n=1 Tax=Gossypium klotzschianum TaxID=34286 RepID=A0A7J8W4B8_9ROSI|nr:hypothetical protein [Gossypium klotzschianum]
MGSGLLALIGFWVVAQCSRLNSWKQLRLSRKVLQEGLIQL